MLANKLRAATAAGGAPAIEDVFSTYIYTGTATRPRTITNGIDLAGEGGLVWIKRRDGSASHALHDTMRGVDLSLSTNGTNAESDTSVAATGFSDLSAFNSDGFDIGNSSVVNSNGGAYVSWTFRKAQRFFDVVTYTGTGSPTTISHNLGSTPGMIIVKRTSGSEAGGIAGWWVCYHRGLSTPESGAVFLNSTDGRNIAGVWNNTAPTSTEFTVNNNYVNYSGDEYVAYLFAHDTEDDGVIQCGSYTGNGSIVGPGINLGWVPQWILIKNVTVGTNWFVMDQGRGTDSWGPGTLYTNTGEERLFPNDSGPEQGGGSADFVDDNNGTGFRPRWDDALINFSGYEYIYVAIRSEGT